ncbi:hypothetical protein MVEG_04542 [Podila verticillata NRRL 6337]|nr:MAG: hypothetical protein BYD32DRAFT_429309 [Podila humilis]KFH69736.1 hypothetical protein MVEG_04542 [Podila verticillata NRRL 6337]
MITTTSVYTSSPLSKKPYSNAPHVASPLSKQYLPTPQNSIPSVTVSPNRHSLPNANILRLNLQQQQQQPHPPPPPQQQPRIQEKPPAKGPRLSLDTSDERLQNTTIIHHNNKQYLKLFSPGLVDSPVSYLDQKQLVEDKKLWENGPDEAFQKQLETDRREAYRARSKQQLRGFFMGLWLGCLLGLLILQQTSGVYFSGQFARSFSSTPVILLLVFLSCVAVVRSGTRCMIAAVATCAAVLTCFATLVANQSHYYSRQIAKSTASSSHRVTALQH